MPYEERHAPITSVDVARRAGVSQATVSLVLGGKATGRVGKRTQEAILRAAQELAYRPNSVARTLRSGHSRLIVLAVPDVSNPYFAAVLQGAEQAARKQGYAVMLASVRDEYDWQQVVLDALTSRSVEGFLIFTLYPPSEDVLMALQGKAVLIDATSHALPSLLLDIEAGMRAAMEHLLNLGHSRIAHLGAAIDADTFHQRRTAYLGTLSAAGLSPIEAYQGNAAFTIDDARQVAHGILAVSPPSAIVCDSDVLAVGVYKAARDLHLAIPKDLSVVSFDDSIIARMLEPELTTVTLPTTVIGEQAFLLLLAVLEKAHVPAQTVVPLELVIRASTVRARN